MAKFKARNKAEEAANEAAEARNKESVAKHGSAKDNVETAEKGDKLREKAAAEEAKE